MRWSFMPERKRHAAGWRAFTLVELLVVMAIGILVMGMLIGGLADLSRARTLRHATETVVNAINQARARAIADNAFYHVRIENRGPGKQFISVHKFTKSSDALAKNTELDVQDADPSQDEWATLAQPVLTRQLDGQAYFETEYDPDQLWDNTRHKPKLLALLHPGLGTLYYSGQGPTAGTGNPYPAQAGEENLLPKAATYVNGSLSGTPAHKLLYFFPDGTASENVLLFVRDERGLNWVQVWKGGVVRSGQISARRDFKLLD